MTGVDVIDGVVKNIIDQMVDQKIITSDSSEIYAYRLVIVLETFLTTITLFVIALFMHRIGLMPVLLFSFACLRRKSGGYHFDSFAECYMGSLLLFSTVAFLIPFIEMNAYVMALAYLAGMVIIYIGFVDHPNLNLDSAGIIKRKKETRLITAIELCIMTAIKVSGCPDKVVLCIAIAVMLDCALMLLGKLKGCKDEPIERVN